MATGLTELREWIGSISDLRRAYTVLQWDQNTLMPPLGAPLRAEQLATLERIGHERLISPRTEDLLGLAEAELDGLAPDSVDARIVSETRRIYEKDRRVPVELAVARARAASKGYEKWVAARAGNDFALFAPALEDNFQLTRDYISCFDGYDDPYDVVLDDYAPRMRTAHASALLTEMRDQLVPLISSLRGREVDVAPLNVTYAIDGQRGLVDQMLRLMGFNNASWRLDDTIHPFEASFSVNDVRLTTRYIEDHFPTALYGAMHECGHGLYEAGIAPEFQRTPLGTIQSSAIHESQSRLWENMVGRSRAFSAVLAPALVGWSGGALMGLQPEELFKAVNAVRPSPIRIEADETTYGLHVILRFELERALLTDELDVADLPEAWNTRMRDYLGVEVRTDSDGVLQDVHWAEGLIGYFPTYAIGNLIAGQMWERAQAEIAGLDEQLATGELQILREWLREKVHRHGSRYSDGELLERVVGGPVAVAPFITYLRAKLSDAYGVTPL
jgi:carboxypeptidase Taq